MIRITRGLATVIMLMSLTAFVMPKPILSQEKYEKYPDRPIIFIVGWGPGGPQDTFGRLMANATSKELRQPIIVENKPGATSMIAAHTIARAKPDGYTLGVAISSEFLLIPNMRKIAFDPLNDPTQILAFLDNYMSIVVRSNAPWKTWEEFRDYSKENPGKVKYGTPGVGSMMHITMERIAQKEGIQWVHVPFVGGNELIVAVLGGHMDAAAASSTNSIPHIMAGALRMLLPLNDKRWEAKPDVPHIMEKGYDFSAFSLLSVWGPKGLPESIRSKLENAMHKAMEDPNLTDTALRFQMKLRFVGGREYTRMLKERFEGFKKIVKDLGLEEK